MVENPKTPCQPEVVQEQSLERFEEIISNLLRAGVWGSIVLVLIGMTITYLHHPSYFTSRQELAGLIHPTAEQPHTTSTVADGVSRMEGQMFIMLGLLLLIATPVLRVAVSIGLYVRQGDRIYVAITTGVLTLLLLSFLMGKAG